MQLIEHSDSPRYIRLHEREDLAQPLGPRGVRARA